MKKVLAALALLLAVGCETKVVEKDVYNVHNLDGTWAGDFEITLKAEGYPDETYEAPAVWFTIDQEGAGTTVFSYQCSAVADEAKCNTSREDYIFFAIFLNKSDLVGDVSRDGSEFEYKSELFVLGEDGTYSENLATVTYEYEIGELYPVVDGEVLLDTEGEAGSALTSVTELNHHADSFMKIERNLDDNGKVTSLTMKPLGLDHLSRTIEVPRR